jgi:hypothetical protein
VQEDHIPRESASISGMHVEYIMRGTPFPEACHPAGYTGRNYGLCSQCQVGTKWVSVASMPALIFGEGTLHSSVFHSYQCSVCRTLLDIDGCEYALLKKSVWQCPGFERDDLPGVSPIVWITLVFTGKSSSDLFAMFRVLKPDH